MFTNPVTTYNAPDPGLIRVADTYYAVTTTDKQSSLETPGIMPILASGDMVNWSVRGAAWASNTSAGFPTWSAGPYYAPEIHKIEDTFWLVFCSVQLPGGPADNFAVGAAWSRSVTGPFTDIGHPLLGDPSGPDEFLDPTLFLDVDPASGRRSLYVLYRFYTDRLQYHLRATQLSFSDRLLAVIPFTEPLNEAPAVHPTRSGRDPGDATDPRTPHAIDPENAAVTNGTEDVANGTAYPYPHHVVTYPSTWWEGVCNEGPWVVRRGPWLYAFFAADR